MHLFGLTGRAGTGKDTVANFLVETHGFVKLAFADPIKDGIKAMIGLTERDIADRANKEAAIDWLGASPRKLMQTLGTDWGREMIHPDLWLILTQRRVERIMGMPACQHIAGVVISDVRFENEADWVRKMGGMVWFVDRPQAGLTGATGSHASEQAIPRHVEDILVDNSHNDLESLYIEVTDIISALESVCKAVSSR